MGGMMESRSPLDARFPDCVDHGSRISALERWLERQNGTLAKFVDALHDQGARLAAMDEKLSMLIARQMEDREAVTRLREIVEESSFEAAKPPQQELDAAGRVLGLPLWKALLYALLLGSALAGGGKGTGALIERLLAPSQHVVQTDGR